MDVAEIQKIANGLPSVTEDIKWTHDLVFSVGGKMFCIVGLEPPFRCSFKVGDEDFDMLSTQIGFSPAPYMARAKWVSVSEEARLSKKDWQQYISGSYELVKQKLTKKVRSELGI